MEDIQSKAAEMMKKVLTVGVGAIFLTEESLRALVSEFKLPKELLNGILDSANRVKKDFLQTLSKDVLSRITDKVDPTAVLQEILQKNEIDLHIKVKAHKHHEKHEKHAEKHVEAASDETER